MINKAPYSGYCNKLHSFKAIRETLLYEGGISWQAKKKKLKQKRERKPINKYLIKQKKTLNKRNIKKFCADDESGTRIGDDGFPMTKARSRLHYLYDGYFFLMIISFLAAVGMIASAFFQGQQLTEWELVAYGGNQFGNFSVDILRIEALFLLFLTAGSLYANMKGMAWLYDKASWKPVRNSMYVLGIISGLYFLGFTFIVGIPDPFSLISIIMAVLMYKFTSDVDQERPTLKKAKVAKTVIK